MEVQAILDDLKDDDDCGAYVKTIVDEFYAHLQRSEVINCETEFGLFLTTDYFLDTDKSFSSSKCTTSVVTPEEQLLPCHLIRDSQYYHHCNTKNECFALLHALRFYSFYSSTAARPQISWQHVINKQLSEYSATVWLSLLLINLTNNKFVIQNLPL